MEKAATAPQPTEPTPPSISTAPASSFAIASGTETVLSTSSNLNPSTNPNQNTQPSISLQPQPQPQAQQQQQPQLQPQSQQQQQALPQPQPQPQPPQPQPQQQQQPQSQQSLPPPQPQQNLQQQTNYQQPQIRPPGAHLNRLRPHSPYQHFPQHLPSLTSSTTSSPLPPSLSSAASPSISTPPIHRGGIAIGVPAHHARPQQSTSYSSFSTSFNQPFTGLPLGSVNVTDAGTSTTNATTVRPTMQGVQGIGMVGLHGSGPQLRPGGVSGHPQQRPVQSSIRSQSPSSSQSLASQKFQGHSLLRVSSMGSPGSPSLSTPQNSQNPSQPWMSAGQQGKQTHPSSLPSPSYRPQMKPQSLQQRSHIPQQQHHPLPMASHQQQMTSAQQQQQASPSQQSQEHYGQQYPPPRVPQSLVPHQQQVTRGQGSGSLKSPSLASNQPTNAQSGPQNIAASADAGEYGNQILSKRSIHELVSQIDPSERLDAEVEDVLVEIADEFVESITTFACSLAKHRKSTTLEAKDVLLHLERNWNIALPGFGGDEIKSYKKPFAADIHKERLAAIKKSIVGVEAVNTKSSVGQAAGNLKGHAAKAPVSVLKLDLCRGVEGNDPDGMARGARILRYYHSEMECVTSNSHDIADTKPEKIIIDTDPGIDDSIAILMAFQTPEVEILGLTTIFGNVSTEGATRNALLLCDIAGRPDIPVAEGSSEPLKGGKPHVADFVHGSNGLGNIFIPPSKEKKIEKSASEFLVDKVSEYPGEVSILALGPLTNLALAIKRDSSFASKVKRLVVLGGAFFALGNVTPGAEANIYGDPEAADIVFTSGANIVVVGINITTQVKLKDEDLSELRDSQGRHCQFLGELCKFYRDWHVESDGVYGIFPHDPVCFAALVRPDLFTFKKGVVRVETQGICVGHTIMDQGLKKWNTSNPWSGYAPVSVAWMINVEGVVMYIKEQLMKP
ncbi:hypothetical protein NE237_003613 [Protea cynaroides]|uniref:uridine nucleosidase n=1 Tax=Protea cynaroides TaxID=273540 RepID=A0A9Q0QSW8_9MAGN|nr:hypothetical protein NE237_003613 [Protea cynaroides]